MCYLSTFKTPQFGTMQRKWKDVVIFGVLYTKMGPYISVPEL